MSRDGARALGHTEQMIEWYWAHGCKRTDRARLSADWIIDLYRQRMVARAVHSLGGDDRRVMAVWGPSQAGKSTMLSEYFDVDGKEYSALCWDGAHPMRFQYDKNQPSVPGFNPHNGGNDASGCVTRFAMHDRVEDTVHPIEIVLLDRSQILQAVAAGYLSECDLKLPGGRIVHLDAVVVRGLLGEADNPMDIQAVPNREAIEFLVDVVGAVGRLIREAGNRFVNLGSESEKDPRQTVWEAELVREILDHKGLSASMEKAKAFAFKLLWDGRLNDFYNRLDDFHRRLMTRFGHSRRIFCQLKLGAYMVDIAAYRRLEGQARDEHIETTRLDLLVNARCRIANERVLLSIGGAGQPMFNSPDDFGYFQGLVWELRVPLNSAFIDARSPVVAEFFKVADLLDVPGVSEFEAGAQQIKKIRPEETASAADGTVKLLGDVLKRGKTSTIINRYAHEMRIDLLLLLQHAMKKPAKPAQLYAGAAAIWHEIDPTFVPGTRGRRPPIPTALCITFLSQLVHRINDEGTDKFDLNTLQDRLVEYRELAEPEVAEFFVTTYPQHRDGALQDDIDVAARQSILAWLKRQPFVTNRFLSAASQESLDAMMLAGDGGVAHLIGALTERISTVSRSERIERRLPLVEEAIKERLKEAIPVRDETSDRHREIIARFADHLNTTLADNNPQHDTRDLALEYSAHLRQLLAFEASHFKPLPRNIDHARRAELKAHIEKELSTWAGRGETRVALDGLGVASDDQPILMSALRASIDVDGIVDWTLSRLAGINEDNVAKQARRYLAARCAESLLQRPGIGNGVSDPFHSKFQQNLIDQFETWEAMDRKGTASPHYSKVIEPFVDRLIDIAGQGLDNRWVDQPGDNEIEELHRAWAQLEQSAQGEK